MDAPLNGREQTAAASKLLITAVAPLLPQILGSIFNIWYNMAIIRLLLLASGLTHRFVQTAIWWNATMQRTVQLKTLPPQPVKGVDQPVEVFTLAD
jgi:hypothetical protein